MEDAELDGWEGVGAPVYKSNYYFGLFFVAFIYIGSFFCINLYTGVI